MGTKIPYIPHTEEDKKEMLKRIGVSSFEELLKDIPEGIRVRDKINLPEPLSELEVGKLLREIASQNISTHISFLGGGSYDHFIPSVIDHILSRPEFYTAYTPYQAEVSQGTLQSIYEYQSLIAELFKMDVSNASMYDGPSALAESLHMARDITQREKALISQALNPLYLEVVKTYGQGLGVELEEIPERDGVTDLDSIKERLSDSVACLIIQHPNYYGNLENIFEISEAIHSIGGLLIVSVDPISLGILAPPGEYGADIATGEGQPLGIPLGFGGPYLGIFTTRRDYIRRLPGRLIGETTDREKKRGFVMTLQTREQHIRRERATSNICTNEALCALAAGIYLSLFGKEGIREVAYQCVLKSHYLASRIEEVEGYKLAFQKPFFKEFVIKTPIEPKKIMEKFIKEGILPGIDIGDNRMLIAVTEKRTREEMDKYVELLKNLKG